MELKQTISRSYTQKVNLGNYESADFWAMRSMEVPGDATNEQLRLVSEQLFEEARKDVQDQLKALLRSRFECQDIIERVRGGGSLTVEEYEKCVESGLATDLNDAKKEYKRSPEYKEKVDSRGHREGYKPKN